MKMMRHVSHVIIDKGHMDGHMELNCHVLNVLGARIATKLYYK